MEKMTQDERNAEIVWALKEMMRVWNGLMSEVVKRNPDSSEDERVAIVTAEMNRQLGLAK